MISAQTDAALTHLFETSVREQAQVGNTHCDIAPCVAAATAARNGEHRHLVALSIVSYQFRIVTLFDFATDEATTRYLVGAQQLHQPPAPNEFHDACAELANMICGSVNRRLGSNFRHSGLSTPHHIEHNCINYLDILKPARVKRFDVTVAKAANFSVFAALMPAAGITFELSVPPAAAVTEGSGELELF
jgi:hypothetical protein